MKTSFSNSNQSGKRRARFAFLLAVVLGSCVITELRAQVVVVPNVLATNDGNTFVPGTGGSGGGSQLMTIYDASQFGALSGPSFLTQLARRPDTIPGNSGPRTTTLRIYVSTTSRSPAGMSATFADNRGTNNTLVFDGTLTRATENLPGPGNTRQFDNVFPFTTPFLYDPAAGNLTVEFQTSSVSGEPLAWDVVTEDPFVSSVQASDSPSAPTGNPAIGRAPVTQFTFAAPALATIRTSQMEVCWNSQSNVTYQVQYRSDLTTNLWTSLVGCVRSTGSVTCINDPVVVGQQQRFYRVLLTNCVP